MVVDSAFRVDAVFHALADPTRRDIVRRTLAGEFSVSGLARDYPMSFAAVQKHVVVLEEAGLVIKRRNGREQLVSGRIDSLLAAQQALGHLVELGQGRIDRIDAILTDTEGEMT